MPTPMQMQLSSMPMQMSMSMPPPNTVVQPAASAMGMNTLLLFVQGLALMMGPALLMPNLLLLQPPNDRPEYLR